MPNLRAGLLLILAATPSAAQRTHNPDSARVITEDIPRFWQAFDARTRLGTARALDSLYLKPGTAGLRDFVRVRLDDDFVFAKPSRFHAGIEDVAAASMVLERALADGAGLAVRLGN